MQSKNYNLKTVWRESIILNGRQIKTYNIRTITLEQFRMLIACGNDSHNNQIRVTKRGMVYLSEDIVGSEQLDDVALSFETFSAHNGYVGVKAAEDNSLRHNLGRLSYSGFVQSGKTQLMAN